ncbi:MAG: M23 family metallopeptidase [Ilumatobacter sp.]|uniref:M23 family metallopeptidase n=1 Tax=Ilumatobacter sp. TaxID=1967498 RepID=UPI0039199AC2
MTEQHEANSITTPARPKPAASLSRRRFLTIASALGVYSLTHADHVLAQTTGVSGAASLGQPATALAPAERLPSSTPFEPLAPGEILFPIVVGPDDYCYASDSFGDCRGSNCSRSHEGVDIMADKGLPIRATVDGRLVKRYVDTGKTYGAGDGWTLFDESTQLTCKYFHMGSHEEGLEVGDYVVQGQIIGYVGNTGTSGVLTGTNYHLHFEYRPNNVPADPFHLFQRDPDVRFAS